MRFEEIAHMTQAVDSRRFGIPAGAKQILPKLFEFERGRRGNHRFVTDVAFFLQNYDQFPE